MGDIKPWNEEKKISVRAIIEVLGKPKEHVENTLKSFVDTIKEDKDFKMSKENFAEAKEQGKMWGTFVELEFFAKNVTTVTGFCFDYMPSSIEILDPPELRMKCDDLSDFFNDVQAKLHGVDMMLKQAKSENEFLKKNVNALLRNLITISLHKSPKNLEKLSKITGVNGDELTKYLDLLIKIGIIKEEKGVYSISKNE